MSKIKQYFKKKKDEAAFKFKLGGGSLGQGHSLSSSEPGTSSSQGRKSNYEEYVPPKRKELSNEAKAAAEAALARIEKRGDAKTLNTSLAAIKARAKQELQAEAAALKQETECANNENAPTSNVASIFYRCPLVSDEILPRKEWRGKIKEFLYQQLENSDEKALTSCLIIQNCNSKEKAEECVQTLCKYLENIINHPNEEKYCSIRMSNRIFSDKVRYVEGALDFLNACGFREIMLDNELFLIWSKDNIEKDYDLPLMLESLRNAEQIHLELDRNIKVLLPSQAKNVSLPDDFYRISPEELKREQQLRTEALENAQILKTKAMREREEQRLMRMYKYALIRVKFPNGLYIQGTFDVYEKLIDVYEFVQSCLQNECMDFNLMLPNGGKFSEDDMEKTLFDLRLIPNVVLLFTSPGELGSDGNFLKEDLLLLVQNM
ncbi:UBX domain-containing protein 6 [Musca vetustissima]|uniref:UBX domain-containing protein 6 n=1 Tax=Musca vetustissima TaxID=27455 RepID=UPI002AB6F387|nr:UBX domain-containing protein 6 [Musca vetustissima]